MPAVESKNYDLPQEDLARDGITLKESEGWRLDSIVTLPVFSTDASGRRVPSWGGIGRGEYETVPIVDRQTTLVVGSHYILGKYASGDTYVLQGGLAKALIFLKIYKNDVEIISSTSISDSNGIAEFNITFREPGYYAYEVYTDWKEKEISKKFNETFYVKPAPTSTAVSQQPVTSQQTVTRPKTPGFEVMIACIGMILALAFRRK